MMLQYSYYRNDTVTDGLMPSIAHPDEPSDAEIRWPWKYITRDNSKLREFPQRASVGDYRERWGGDTVSFTPDVGAPMRRARSTRMGRRFEVSFLLDMHERDILEDFYYNVIMQGAKGLWFFPPSASGNVTQSMDLKFMKWVGGAPQVQAEGPTMFRVGIRLEEVE